MKLNKTLLFQFILASTIPVIFMGCSEKKETKQKKTEKKLLSLVKIQKAERKEFKHQITSQGNIKCSEEAMLNAEIGGLVSQIHIKEGDYVNKGQVLISMDTELMALNLNELDTQMKYAKFLLNKQSELNEKGLGTEMELEAAFNQVASLSAKRRIINAQINKSKIVSPFAGIIDKIYTEKGQMVGPQSPVIHLMNNKNMELISSISEKYLSKVGKGSTIEVSFPNYSDTILNLKIDQISKSIDATNRTFEIKSTLKENKLFLSNMLAEVKITDLFVKDGLIIPSKAIMKSPDNIDFIFVATKTEKGNYKVEEVNVEVIEKYNQEALIKDNKKISNSSLVVVEGGRGIASKDLVRIN